MSIKSGMPSNHFILCCPFSSHLQSFPASESFQMSQLFASGGQSITVSASPSVLPVNTQDWSPLGWTGWVSLQSKRLSRVFSNTTQFKTISSSVLSFLYSSTLTSLHDYWKNHSLDYMDLCWQSNMLSRLVIMKKEFIGPGLHLRPVHADHARPPLQGTLNSVFSVYGNNNRRIRPPPDRGILKIISRLLLA